MYNNDNDESAPYGYPYNSQFNAITPSFVPSPYQGSGAYQYQSQHLPPAPPGVAPANNPYNYPNYPNYPYQYPPSYAPYPGSQPQGRLTPDMTNKNNKEKGIKRKPQPQPQPQSNPKPEPEARDKKAQPSAESGGIPEPTPAYLRLASLPPFTLPRHRKILVVIDLNGTVLYRPNRRYNPTGFVERAHARAFLAYCIETFFVVIWSSATPKNVHRMCEQLLTPEQRSKVVAIWSRDRFGLSARDYEARVVCYKRLTKLWADPAVQASHPEAAQGKVWDQSNTLLIDDTLEKARAEPYNLVEVPEFAGETDERGDVLAQVHDYINACALQMDVSTYIRTHPFKADPDHVLHPHDGSPAREEAYSSE
ncbi:phosphoprotein phosphatase [Hypoxylon sp. FL1150]|nr:phosphoprotein phosphatase [Hypoxylon sp. FL1150]